MENLVIFLIIVATGYAGMWLICSWLFVETIAEMVKSSVKGAEKRDSLKNGL